MTDTARTADSIPAAARSARPDLRGRRGQRVVYFSMFVMGGCGLAYEYTLSMVASNLLGSSARQWAAVIGVMMFFMGVGSDLQKKIASSRLIEKLLAAEIALAFAGASAPIGLLLIYGTWPDAYLLAQYGWIAAIGLLIGIEIPLLARINEGYGDGLAFNLGNILKMDYLGALCGAMVWIFVLPPFFSLTEGAVVLGLANLAAAAVALVWFWPDVRRPGLWAASFGLCFAVLGVALGASDTWTLHAEQRLYRDRVVHSETTPFQHIVLTRTPAGDTALYLDGHLQFHSFDEHIYHESLVHPAMALVPRASSVLILGGGDGLALREVLKYPRVERVTLVDLDPAITRLSAEHPALLALNQGSLGADRVRYVENRAAQPGAAEPLGLPNHRSPRFEAEPGPQVHVMNVDAAEFVEQVPGLYDVILLDFPDPKTAELAKLYSVGFYSLLRGKLAAHGVFAQQSSSPVHAREAFLCIGRTLAAAGLSALPYHEHIPSFGEWGFWIGSHAASVRPEDLERRLEALERIEVPTRHLTPDTIRASLIFGKGELESPERDITTLTHSAVFDHYLEAWRRY